MTLMRNKTTATEKLEKNLGKLEYIGPMSDQSDATGKAYHDIAFRKKKGVRSNIKWFEREINPLDVKKKSFGGLSIEDMDPEMIEQVKKYHLQKSKINIKNRKKKNKITKAKRKTKGCGCK
jgi:hypothetical protein